MYTEVCWERKRERECVCVWVLVCVCVCVCVCLCMRGGGERGGEKGWFQTLYVQLKIEGQMNRKAPPPTTNPQRQVQELPQNTHADSILTKQVFSKQYCQRTTGTEHGESKVEMPQSPQNCNRQPKPFTSWTVIARSCRPCTEWRGTARYSNSYIVAEEHTHTHTSSPEVSAVETSPPISSEMRRTELSLYCWL